MRPLRLVNKFPELRDTVKILVSCIPDLGNAVGLVSFILLISGILGIQLFGGVLRGVCFSIEDGSIRERESPCGYLSCGENFECLRLGENPSRGVVTFDYIGASMMTVFQIMTYEGWNDAMYGLQDSLSPYCYFYFIAIIVSGPIFALQLFLVVISNKYNSVKREEQQTNGSANAEEAEAMKKLDILKQARLVPTVHNVGMTALVIARMRPEANPGSCRDTNDSNDSMEDTSGRAKIFSSPATRYIEESAGARPTITGSAFGTDEAPRDNASDEDRAVLNDQKPYFPIRFSGARIFPHDPLEEADNKSEVDASNTITYENTQVLEGVQGRTLAASRKASRLPSRRESEFGEARRKKSLLKRVKLWVKEFAMSEGLQDFVSAMIVLNTCFMAADSNVNLCQDDDPAPFTVFRFKNEYFFNRAEEQYTTPINPSTVSYKAVVEGSNLFFTFVFVVELLIKFFGYGPKRFFMDSDGSSIWNIFDCFVVALSISEVNEVLENTKCYVSASNCYQVSRV